MKMQDFIKKYLSSDLDATLWVLGYLTYAHSIDDVIDGDKTDSTFILNTFRFAPVLFSNSFYLNHIGALYPLVIMAHDTYEESVKMEKSTVKWQRHYADVLRQNGNEVLLKCVEIVGGLENRKLAAVELRELAYKTHHTDEGKPT